MELLFNHRFGRVEQQDLVISDVLALLDNDNDEAEMLNNGWLALDRPHKIYGADREVFYQSRSTRINLYACKKRFSQHTIDGKRIEMKEIFPRKPDDTVWTGMHQLYDAFITRKSFRNLYNPFEHISKRDSFLIFYTGDLNNIVGFTKIKRYYPQEQYYDDLVMAPDWIYAEEPHGIESVMHCNNQPISQLTMDMEIQWAKKQSAQFYYAGAGYERSSIYKSVWKGFEWWTGTRWSRSKKEYARLCERDSKLKSISDLGNAK